MENKSSTCHMTSEQRLIDVSPVIRDLTAMKSAYDAIALDGMIKALKEAPTVDAVEVVHGEWIEKREIPSYSNKNLPVVECSKCRCLFCDIINVHSFMYHYCPHCGAKMRGNEE